MASLQDQLLNAGLIDTKKAKQAKKDKRKKANIDRRSKDVQVDETKAAAEAAKTEKVARDRELNRQREEQAQQKAIAAQIKQLIQNHSKSKLEGVGEVEYNFTDNGKIKKMMVSTTVQRQIINGVLTIVNLESSYHLIPAVVADKIAQRDDSCIVVNNVTTDEQADEDDPYKDYVIPDDIMW